MREGLAEDGRISDGGDDLQSTTAVRATLDVAVEDASK
jgi:hypothetical protein